MKNPVSFKQFLMAVYGISWNEWDENYSGNQAEEIREEYEHYAEDPDAYEEYFEADYTSEVPPQEGKYDSVSIAKLIKEHGHFEIVSSDTGRYTITLDGKTYSADVDLDTYSRGAGIESPDDVKEYEQLSNPVFDYACSEIAWDANESI